MTRFAALRNVSTILLFCLVIAASTLAQTFTTLVNFTGDNGRDPYLSSLVQGTDGNLYGVTLIGGVSTSCQALGVNDGCGIFFRMTPDGTLTTIYNFCQQSGCTDGYLPMGITLSSNGSFYGTTQAGGANREGTIFRITPRGTLTTLYSFCAKSNCADGAVPLAGLVQATDGNWYGTTFYSENSGEGSGTIFRMTSAGQLTTLYTFPSSGNPAAALIQGRDGNLYGTATGNNGGGGASTIFKITLSGVFTTLYQFESPADVYTALVQGADGNFYGTSATGGTNISGYCTGLLQSCGTVFRITPGGALTTIYNFCNESNCADGAAPFSPLIHADNGKFYGMTYGGGSSEAGTVFSISSAGALSTLESFVGANGAGPYSGFAQHTSGVLFGMTSSGGTSLNYGDVFSANLGLPSCVSFVRSFGKVGEQVEILGQGFTGTTAVSFNGTSAAFTVKAETFLTATVPSGATSGFMTVTTPSGALISNLVFRVRP